MLNKASLTIGELYRLYGEVVNLQDQELPGQIARWVNNVQKYIEKEAKVQTPESLFYDWESYTGRGTEVDKQLKANWLELKVKESPIQYNNLPTINLHLIEQEGYPFKPRQIKYLQELMHP